MTRYCHFCGEAEGLSRYCIIRRMPNMPHQALLAGDLVDLEWIPVLDLRYWGKVHWGGWPHPGLPLRESHAEQVAQRLRGEYLFAHHHDVSVDAIRYAMYPPPMFGGAQDPEPESPRTLVRLLTRVAGFFARLWQRVTRSTSKLGV